MITLQYCEMCAYFDHDASKTVCAAYPDGIPDDVFFESGPGYQCKPGYSFRPEPGTNGHMKRENKEPSIHSRLLKP